MELSKLKTEKKNHYISGNGTQHFSAQGQEIKNIHPEKISYTLGNGNSEKSCQKKLLLCFGKTETWKNSLHFRKPNFPSSKNKKNPLLKCFLYFGEKNVLAPSLKKLRAFHHCFLSCFHFTTDFYYCFWVFSLLNAFVNFINFMVFHHCLGVFILLLIFTIVFRMFSFYKLSFPWLFFYVDVPWVLRIGESNFLLSVIFFLTLLHNIWHNLLLSRLFCK